MGEIGPLCPRHGCQVPDYLRAICSPNWARPNTAPIGLGPLSRGRCCGHLLAVSGFAALLLHVSACSPA